MVAKIEKLNFCLDINARIVKAAFTYTKRTGTKCTRNNLHKKHVRLETRCNFFVSI